ncbi:F0F1 ATP synthase subunit delta [Clostridium sp. D2Q-14]|uniref:F0F1 ATP synthase subunit delta n=1 Tax=Anaeromonas gelatinilytica TaxID=2683194 RepID=UPI00193B6C8E|nr:F0F1 ATP synthase subunit delta [Anaeromonas gelatinilytica]MBS4536442.1 F0F1 ATP synthase subunit delta [Anaeromonas gelatinilytica]
MAELIAKRYAEAFFEVAVETDNLEEFKEEISAVSKVLEEEEKLKIIFEHPKLSRDEKKDILNSLFKGKVSNEIMNLLYIVVDKGRERYIKAIEKEYIALANEKQGIVEGKAITAIKMEDSKLRELEEKLSKKFNKKFKLINEIDKDILGGVLVKIGDKVIDSSVKGQINKITKELNTTTVTKKEVKNS